MQRFIAGTARIDVIEWTLFLLLFGIVAPLLGSDYWVYLISEIMIWGFFAIGFNLLFGMVGLLSFGQAAFFGLGAYCYALLMTMADLPFGVCVLLGVFIPSLFALVLGPLCVRMKEVYFALMTLAFAQLIWAITFKWYGFTGGDNGIQGVPAPAFLDSPTVTYYMVFGVVYLGMVLCWLIRRSPFGRILSSIKENPERSSFMGINPKRYQLAAFVMSAFFCSLAGVLFVLFQRSIHPQIMHWTTSGDVVLMTILGGYPTFFGSMVGAVIILVIRDLISAYTEYWSVFVGMIILLCVILFPHGILGTLHFWVGSRKKGEVG
jgi:branched-chain amino acid transport system permease protein